MSDQSTAYLKDRCTGKLVAATLIDGVSRDEVERAESSWRPILLESLETRESGMVKSYRPEHGHWDWRKKHAAIEGLIAYRMFGIECEGTCRG